jgi:hypothetical protein
MEHSLPLSKALPKSFVILISWLTAESPFVNPDWQVVRISYPIDDCEYVYIHNAPLNYVHCSKKGTMTFVFCERSTVPSSS